jgi:O-antigen ligase
MTVKPSLNVVPASYQRADVWSRSAEAVGDAWPASGSIAAALRNTLLAPVAVLLAGVRWLVMRPAVIVALTVLMVCVPLGSRDVSAAVHVTPGDLCAVFLVAVVTTNVVTRGARLPRSGLWWALSAVTFGFALATVVSHDPLHSAFGFIRYAELFVVLPLAVVLAVRRSGDALLICGAVVAAALVEGSVGVVQYVGRTGASYQGHDVRAIGTFSALDVQAMSTVVGYGLVIAVGLALTLTGPVRNWLVAIAALLVVPLLLSLSRGGLIATSVAVVAMLLVKRPRLMMPIAVYGSALALLIIGVVGPNATGIGARLGSIGTSTSAPDQSVTDRYVLWKTAAAIWRDHPLTGVGLKQFPAFRDSYAPVNLSSGSDVANPGLGFQREPLLSPHNMYLLVLSEQGLIGALCFGGLMFGLLWMTIRRARECRRLADRTRRRSGGSGVISVAAVGIIVWTVINFMYGDIGGQTTVLMSIMLGLALWLAVQPPPRDPTTIVGAP